jgi:branched-chain amino acid transport system permease protein
VAIREDEIAAGLRHQHPQHEAAGLRLGATFGGVAGGLFAGFQGFVSPESFGLMESMMVLCMVVLGGMGNIAGVILGAVLLRCCPRCCATWRCRCSRRLFGKVLLDPESLRMLLFGWR